MRILFFSHYFPPEGNAPATRTHENARRWVQAGHQVTVITCAPNVPDGVVYEGFRNRLRQVSWVDGIKVIRVWTHIAPNKGTTRRILNFVSYMLSALFFSLFTKRPDIIIATSPQFFCGWAGVLAKWLRRRPFILEIRDIWPDSILAVGAMSNRRILGILQWLEIKMYGAADRIVTVGEGYRKKLIQKQVDPEKISVIMNGLNRERFIPSPPNGALKAKWGVENKFICSYIGTIGMACGLEVVLSAARILKRRGSDDVAFMLIGDGAVREELERECREQGLDNIIFTGRQAIESIPPLLAISDVSLVHLKKVDLFATVMPSKIFEAAGMEKPIINGVAGYAADFIDRAGAGINIEPENSKALVAAILTLQANPERRKSLGLAGRKFVTKNFDRDRLAADFLTLNRNLAARKKGTA